MDIKQNSDPGLPRYQRVKRYLIQGVESGQWPVGAKVPSENVLASQLGVSRMTANRAMKELTEEGFLVRSQGLGTFVAKPKPSLSLVEIKNIADEIEDRGHTYSCQVIDVSTVSADENLAGQLGVPQGSDVYYCCVVHEENAIPVQLEQRYVNPAIAPQFIEQNFREETPSAYLSRVAPLSAGEHMIEAISPDRLTRQHLAMESGQPCLLIERRTWAGPTLASYARLIHPGSRYRLRSQVKTPHPDERKS